MVSEVSGERSEKDITPEVRQLGQIIYTSTDDQGVEHEHEMIVSNLYAHEVDGQPVACKFEVVYSADCYPGEKMNYDIIIGLMQAGLEDLKKQADQ